MQLTILETNDVSLRAGYSCPCGCTPSVEYGRGAELVEEGCCCGNHFAVGPRAAASLSPKAGFRPELQTFNSPWGERLEAAWLVGPSVHGPSEAHDHEHADGHEHQDGHEHGTVHGAQAIDPVCGMTVEPEWARAKGLHSSYQGTGYYFCGKGCKLEFDEQPDRYLDPSYMPSM
jgi:YHS domain-containing protein